MSVLTGPAIVRRVDEIIVGKRHRRELGDVASLARSIEQNTLLHPIVIRADGRLIAGERRLEAYKLLGRAEIPATVVDLKEIVRGELAENADRLNFQPSEIDAIRRALEPIEKAAAKERMRRRREVCESFAPFPRERQDRRLRRRLGATVRKIAAIVAAAETEPERFGKLAADMDRSGRVEAPYRRLRNIQKSAVIRAEQPPLPSKGPYRVIAADPPWPYESPDGRPIAPGRAALSVDVARRDQGNACPGARSC